MNIKAIIITAVIAVLTISVIGLATCNGTSALKLELNGLKKDNKDLQQSVAELTASMNEARQQATNAAKLYAANTILIRLSIANYSTP